MTHMIFATLAEASEGYEKWGARILFTRTTKHVAYIYMWRNEHVI